MRQLKASGVDGHHLYGLRIQMGIVLLNKRVQYLPNHQAMGHLLRGRRGLQPVSLLCLRSLVLEVCSLIETNELPRRDAVSAESAN